MSHFYTRSGDDGYTGLLGKGRVPKYHLLTEAVGSVDEASAALGMLRSICRAQGTAILVLAIQRDLYGLMAELSATPENASRFHTIDTKKVAWLEEQTDALSQQVEIPKEFIVPGDSPSGAVAALARTVVRRAERRVAELLHQNLVENHELLRYLNRLSSLCFVLELLENKVTGQNNPTLAKQESTE
jgi:cob(I)alamin adenosyltransferase